MKISTNTFLHVNREFNDFQKACLRVILQKCVDPNTRKAQYNGLRSAFEKEIFEQRKSTQLKIREGVPAKKGDMVHRPDHYARFPIEPTYFCQTNELGWCVSNFIKYICRYPFKNGDEDLRKAQRYLDMYEKYLNGDPEWSL